MTYEFDRATAVTETDRTDSGARFLADLDGGWGVGPALNGGYLMATAARALRQTVPELPDPIAFSAYFLSAGAAGKAEVSTRIIRRGGTSANLAVDLVQDGATRITALANYGDLAALPGGVRTTAQPPRLPSVDECLSTKLASAEMRQAATIMDRMDLRLDPAYAGWAVGAPSGEGVIQGWIRLPDGREPDALSLLWMLDALPPVTFDLGLPGWAPTLELSAHLRAVPAPGWLAIRHATRNVAGGMFEEDCELWDSAGRLVAQSRQLARLPR